MSTKVFVGNLAFRTTDQGLQEAFSSIGEIKSAVIITRGRRSLGYGFVEFVNAADAAASVEKLNKSDLLDRQIKVELAKDVEERPSRTRRIDGDLVANTDDVSGSPHGVQAPRFRRKGRSNITSNSNNSNSNNYQVNTDNSIVPTGNFNPGNDNNTESGFAKRRRNRRRRARGPKTISGDVIDEGNNVSVTNDRSAPKRRNNPNGEQVFSKTTLFVANLPFSVDDAGLANIFQGTNYKSAHVVHTRNNRSRGYGFVEFENEEDQQRALREKNGFAVADIEGRESRNIAISVSSSSSSAQMQPTATTIEGTPLQ